MSEDHFIDTNLVIGYTVAWDNHRPKVKKYVNFCKDISVYATERVLTEAERVINERRRLASQAANRIFHDFSGTPPINLDHVVNFTRRELGGNPSNAVDHVIQYIKSEPTLYKSLIGTDNPNALNLTVDDINSDFNQAVDVIDQLRLATDPDFDLELFTGHLQDHSSEYSCFSRLDSIFGSSTVDRDILLDAHHFTQTTGPSPLQFVTMDFHHIHANSGDIESLLGGIQIKKPDDFRPSG